jgi:hypothetical protein
VATLICDPAANQNTLESRVCNCKCTGRLAPSQVDFRLAPNQVDSHRG